MKTLGRIKIVLLAALIFIFGTVIVSCGGTDSEGEGENSGDKSLVGTKWTTTNWDFSVGDDWASAFDETYNIYFYSQTEGVLYYGRKDLDSDFGSSSSRCVAHFTYEVEDGVAILYYINNPRQFLSSLNIGKKTISMNGMNFNKGTIDSSDKSWLNSLTGETGDCKWYYDLAGALFIMGNGDMADYTSFIDTPWGRNKLVLNRVEIGTGVTSVGSFAFANPSIGEVYIDPYSKMKKIGASAFAGTAISEINLPYGITVIDNGAFCNCVYLTKIYLPDELEEIGSNAFYGCKQASLVGTNELKYIGDYAFMGCDVTSWTGSQKLKIVGTMALDKCTFSKLVLPNSITSLGSFAFGGRISEIHIGTGRFTTTGMPFATATSGKLYVNQNAPMVLDYDIVDANKVHNWTLYVPRGSKSAYSKSKYWKNFKAIIEESTLEGDGTEAGGGDDGNDESYTGIIQGHEYVDLGLSVKWATCNVGASGPYQYGDYFCYGRTSNSWDTPSFDPYGSGTTENISGTSSDVAYKTWGNKWKIPTQSQFQELIENCTFTPTKIDGNKVIKVTSKINKQSIIFPLCGYKQGFYERGDTKFETKYSDRTVYLWTSNGFGMDKYRNSANVYKFGAWYDTKEVGCSSYFYISNAINSQTYKMPIRPVTE